MDIKHYNDCLEFLADLIHPEQYGHLTPEEIKVRARILLKGATCTTFKPTDSQIINEIDPYTQTK